MSKRHRTGSAGVIVFSPINIYHYICINIFTCFSPSSCFCPSTLVVRFRLIGWCWRREEGWAGGVGLRTTWDAAAMLSQPITCYKHTMMIENSELSTWEWLWTVWALLQWSAEISRRAQPSSFMLSHSDMWHCSCCEAAERAACRPLQHSAVCSQAAVTSKLNYFSDKHQRTRIYGLKRRKLIIYKA